MKTTSTPYGSFRGYQNAYVSARKGGASAPEAWFSIFLARAVYGFGPKFHSLFELWRTPRENWPAFIVNNEANEKHRLLSDARIQGLTDNKLEFYEFCVEHGLPTIPVLGTLGVGGRGKKAVNIEDRHSWGSFISSAPSRLFMKPLDGKHGEGTFSATRHGERWVFAGIEGDADGFYDFCQQNLSGTLLIQPAICPHAEIRSRFSPKALCTVRAVTFMSPEGAHLLFSLLRLPVGDNETDNWSVGGATGNLVAPIDPESGVMGLARGSRNNEWPLMYSTETYPDTGERIVGYRLPCWGEVKSLVLDAQMKLPSIPTLGWDVAITDDGPVLIETNWGYGVEIVQVALRRGVRGDLERIFDSRL